MKGRSISMVGLMAGLVFITSPARARSETLRIGLTPLAVSTLSVNDGKAAIDVWAQAIAGEVKLDLKTEVTVYPSSAAFMDALHEGQPQLAIMDFGEYQRVTAKTEMDAVFLYQINDRSAEPMILVVREDSGIQKVADLRDKSLLFHQSIRTTLGEPWLAVELNRNHLPSPSNLLARLDREAKAQRCLYRVFFKNEDACIVNEQSFLTAAELNPQLGAQLRIIARSAPLTSTVIAFPHYYISPLRNRFETALTEAHEGPKGQQTLTVFGIERIIRCPPGAMDASAELWKEYSNLLNSSRAPEAL